MGNKFVYNHSYSVACDCFKKMDAKKINNKQGFKMLQRYEYRVFKRIHNNKQQLKIKEVIHCPTCIKNTSLISIYRYVVCRK